MASNVQKMRELVGTILKICTPISTGDEDDPVERIALLAEEALAIPLRNCDVGTAEEQIARYGEFSQRECLSCDKSISCHIRGESYRMKCMMGWAQMPY